MPNQTSFSVLVTGVPPGIHVPNLNHGETKFQFLIRNHPFEWKNFVDWIGGELDLSESDRKKLVSQDSEVLNRSQIMPHVASWANMRLPVPWRTLQCLSDLRSALVNKPMNQLGLHLGQIFWPREENPNGDDSAERTASEMGVKVIRLPVGYLREIDLKPYIQMVEDRYLWVIPGGSRFWVMTGMTLDSIFQRMDMDLSVAMYSDGAYSMIYRLSALQFASDKAHGSPLTNSYLCTLWERMGSTCMVARDPENPLCEIEKIYGGTYPFPKPAGRFSWIRRLFGG